MAINPKHLRIAFVADDNPIAQRALEELNVLYESCPLEDAVCIVALGGDGFMLRQLHLALKTGQFVYGMNCGTVGFLMNAYRPQNLKERILESSQINLHPLLMRATTQDGQIHEAYAINEVYLLREHNQAAKIRIWIDGAMRLEELMSDGVMVATPAGSTAYNLSAHGPILPIGSDILALTPISAFRPRRWTGAILSSKAQVRFEVLESAKRPVSAMADFHEIRHVKFVEVSLDLERQVNVLFDPEHNLEERILQEQFLS